MIYSRKMMWVGHVAYMRDKSNAYKMLLAKPEGKGVLWMPRHTWKDNIKMGIK
jgi:hypothetical protein